MRNAHRKRRTAPYHESFSQLYEKFEGQTFIQSIIDKLYQEGSCSFSRKETLGSRISFLLHTVGILYEIEKTDDGLMKIIIKQ